MARQAHLFPEFTLGGPEFAQFLHIPDPTYTLPMAAVVLGIASTFTNLSTNGLPQYGLTAGGQRLLVSSIVVATGGIGAFFPAGIQLYGAVTTLTMLLQQLVLYVPFMRKAMGFPDGFPLSEAERAQYAKEIAAQAQQTQVASGKPGSLDMFRGLFYRYSRLAEGNVQAFFKGTPNGSHLNFWGVRHADAPPPPSMPAPAHIHQAKIAAAPAAAAASSAAAAAGGAAPKAAAAPIAAPAPAPAAPAGTAFMASNLSNNRPKRK
jgi:hypothetical protein